MSQDGQWRMWKPDDGPARAYRDESDYFIQCDDERESGPRILARALAWALNPPPALLIVLLFGGVFALAWALAGWLLPVFESVP